MLQPATIIPTPDGPALVVAVHDDGSGLVALFSPAGDVPVAREDMEAGDSPPATAVDSRRVRTVESDAAGDPLGRARAILVDRVLRAMGGRLMQAHHHAVHTRPDFIPGESPVPVSGRVYGPAEMDELLQSAYDFWLTTGRFNDAFEDRLARYVGVKHVLTTNSGSSANLLAVSALTSPKLGDRALKSGDEVITVAAGFPTTVTPILQNGLVPVFVDVTTPTYNIDTAQLAAAIGPKTRAICIAHTLGNPFNLDAVMDLARRSGLWVIEDCCDALGSAYTTAAGETRLCGAFGHIATCSFYPAHHITMGEGGAVLTDDTALKRIIQSFRDWGRDCWCPPGRDDTCRKRFQQRFGRLPEGYDHKYVYSHLGYNLKITDMQAAVGCAQLDRVEEFHAARRRNFDHLKAGLTPLEWCLELPEPTARANPSWFGFPITLAGPAAGRRTELLPHLQEKRIGTRLLFAGNLTRQPCFDGRPHRTHGDLAVTDRIMHDCFWIGVYPGLTPAMLDYVIDTLTRFARERWS